MKYLLTVPMQSGVNTIFGYSLTLHMGGTFVFLRKYDAALTLRLLVEHKITFLPTFPLLFNQIADLPEFKTADLTSLYVTHTGGQRVPAEMLTKWRAKGVMLRQMYGQTEVGGFACCAGDDEVIAGKQTCGRSRSLLHTEVRIVRADGSDCAPGEVGEVRVRGPGMMAGYWQNPEATAKTLIDGWIHTGDLGQWDEDGCFLFVDRAKDMIITGGFNVSPSEVERVVSQMPGVLEVAVIAVPDEKFGETAAAIVYSEEEISGPAIFAFCKERLAGFKLPRYVIPFKEALPRLSTGKLNKILLRSEYGDAPKRFPKLG